MRHHEYRFAGSKIAWAIRPAAFARERSFHFARPRTTRMRPDHRSSGPRPQDAERLAALDHWAALYASDGSSPEQVAAAMTCARAAREISSIRSSQWAIMASIDPAHPKTRSMLAVLARQRGRWQASQQSALDYLEQAAGDR